MELDRFWAKTDSFQSVLTHGKVCGGIAFMLFNEYLPIGCRTLLSKELSMDEERLSRWLAYFVSLHDIGKISYGFQCNNPETAAEMDRDGIPKTGIYKTIRHEKTSAIALRNIWKNAGCDRHSIPMFAEIIGAHHQGKAGEADFGDEIWFGYQNQFEKSMRDFFWKEASFLPTIQPSSQGVPEALLLSFVILSDWIASGELFKEAEAWGDNLIAETNSRVRRFIAESGLKAVKPVTGNEFSEIWPNIPKGGERELQLVTEQLFNTTEERQQLVLIEAPMGEGKTEAGIYAAIRMADQWNKTGLYVGLPTSATSNQMVVRVRKLLEMHGSEDGVKLMHGMAWLSEGEDIPEFDSEEDRYIRSWLAPTRRGLLKPYAVGTVDQVLMAALFVKYGVLRLFGLAGKALLIDEVHAYDFYMDAILLNLLFWCKALEIPVVLLSATLPPEKKGQLFGVYTTDDFSDSYPIVSAVSESGRLTELPFSKVSRRQVFDVEQVPLLHKYEQIASLAMEKIEDGGCCCVIVNTVGQAQSIYSSLRNFDGDVLLFHSRFPAERREEIEKKCIEWFGKDCKFRPKKAILVATQVVEQSLDVDFDCMITSVAPMDLLLQRMGRMFRHSETVRPNSISKPVLTVLVSSNGDYREDGYVYPECLLKRTENLLSQMNEISVPEDLSGLVSAGYDIGLATDEEVKAWFENQAENQAKAASAKVALLSRPEMKLSPLCQTAFFDDLENQSYLSAKTRLSEPTVRIALLNAELFSELERKSQDGRIEIKSRNMAKRILEKSVSVTQKKLTQHCGNNSGLFANVLSVDVIIFQEENPVFLFDSNLGLVWKEVN